MSETVTATSEGKGWLKTAEQDGRLNVSIGGTWTVPTVESLRDQIAAITAPSSSSVRVDVSALDKLDSAGAWTLYHLRKSLQSKGQTVEVTGIQDRHEPLFKIVRDSENAATGDAILRLPRSNLLLDLLYNLGFWTVGMGRRASGLLNFVGMVMVGLFGTLRHPSRLRPISFVNQLELTGLHAIPIVALLSFLIGVTLAYLMADQFRAYGLDVFTVNILGVFVLREGAVLITAIVIAGRSGSAFTAEIGTMKVNEELDAMQTLGLNPIEVLVLPRVLALIITLPILTFIADIAGLLGGAMMTFLILEITPIQFLTQLKGAIGLDTFLVGLSKAPFHACIIAIVGCYEGFQVQRSAESVGKQTTTSVVESIFLVIVATAVFAVIFSILGI